MSTSASRPGDLSAPDPSSISDAQKQAISRAFADLDRVALGAAFAGIAGAGLFLATTWLVVRSGPVVGPHLERLAYFLPGYEVSWPGALVGLVEGAILGFATGFAAASAWNIYHRFFVRLVLARERRQDLRRELMQL